MKNIGLFILTALAAVAFTGCETAVNTPANTAIATPKPAAAAPTKEALFEMDKKANEAWIKGDKAHFEAMLSDKFVSYDHGERTDRAGMLGMIGTFKCDMKTWSLEDPQMSTIDADTYVISYKANFDGSCTGPDGKSMKVPSPVRASSIWVRNGDKWMGAFHSETPIIDPKAVPARADAGKGEPKTDVAKMADTDKDKAAPSNSNTAAPAKPAGGASSNTDALVKLHTSGWEAWKAKDAKAFDSLLTANFAFVDPIGGWHGGGKAEAVKIWIETMKCDGVTDIKVTDGVATALSPTVEILTLKGTANGTCDGQKNAPLYQSAVYVKEGSAWKLAFMFESPVGKM